MPDFHDDPPKQSPEGKGILPATGAEPATPRRSMRFPQRPFGGFPPRRRVVPQDERTSHAAQPSPTAGETARREDQERAPAPPAPKPTPAKTHREAARLFSDIAAESFGEFLRCYEIRHGSDCTTVTVLFCQPLPR